jgi:CRP-like cAMP-binding protein
VEKNIDALLAEHPFFQGMNASYRALIAGCGLNVHFTPGQLLAATEEPANRFFAIRHGRVAIELHAPGRGPLIVQTIEPGEIVGWSWLFPPYHWKFDVRAIETARAISFDGACIRGKCEQDPAMGFDLMKRFARIFAERLEATRVQLLDLYGSPTRSPTH